MNPHDPEKEDPQATVILRTGSTRRGYYIAAARSARMKLAEWLMSLGDTASGYQPTKKDYEP